MFNLWSGDLAEFTNKSRLQVEGRLDSTSGTQCRSKSCARHLVHLCGFNGTTCGLGQARRQVAFLQTIGVEVGLPGEAVVMTVSRS